MEAMFRVSSDVSRLRDDLRLKVLRVAEREALGHDNDAVATTSALHHACTGVAEVCSTASCDTSLLP